MKKKALLILACAAMPLASCAITTVGGDGESMPYTMQETRANINKVVENGGLEVSLKYETNDGEDKSSGSVTFGAADGVYWTVDTGDKEGDAVVFDKGAGKVYGYNYYEGAWEYSYTDDLSTCGYTEDTIFYGFSAWLYLGHPYGVVSKGKGTEKIAGRECVVVEYGVAIFGASAGYTIAFDKETGATLKLKASTDSIEESTDTEFEVTSFKTSGVVAPKLPAPVDVE
ncbi:MAG: hypothetical protein MJ220_03720 [Bacilli bacterium]|nr:hypothetical protein [Bacilli bacterium]